MDGITITTGMHTASQLHGYDLPDDLFDALAAALDEAIHAAADIDDYTAEESVADMLAAIAAGIQHELRGLR